MAVRKPKVVVTRKLPDPVETRMRELFDTELNLEDAPMSAAALASALQRADALLYAAKNGGRNQIFCEAA